MRLKRIEAVRFGDLADATLGDLGDGLTVVLGPNEAGKSSFVALVRHVLFGFPSPSSAESAYESSAGKRQGRLVYASEDGEWVVERVEGPKGGPVEVRTVRGDDRHGLREALVERVSRDACRVVFGFGLAEMAEIEAMKGSDDDIVMKLYAASAGLSVDPHAARKSIKSRSDEIWAPRGRTKLVDSLQRRRNEIRSALREAGAAAESFREQRARLGELENEVALLRRARDDAAARRGEAERALERLEALDVELAEERARASAAEGERAAAAETAAALEPRARLIEEVPRVSALLDEVSGFGQRLESAREARAEEERFAREAEALLTQWNTSADEAVTLRVDEPSALLVARAREETARLEFQVAAATKARDDADAALEAARSGSIGDRTPGRARPPWLSILAAVGFALAFGLALWTREYLLLSLAALFAVLAVLALRATSRAAGGGDDTRRRVEEASRRLAEATRAADLARTALGERMASWSAESQELGFGVRAVDPTSAERLLGAVRDWRRLVGSAERARFSAAGAESELEQFRVRFAEALAPLGVTPPTSLGEVSHAAAAARAVIEEAREAHVAREQALRVTSDAERRRTEVLGRIEVAAAEKTALLQRLGLEDSPEWSLEAHSVVEGARVAHADADETHERALSEAKELYGRVSALTADADDAADLRLELAGVEERLADAVDEYAVLQVAMRLLGETQSRYEKERQPEVVRRAEHFLRLVTGERYVRVNLPLGGGEVQVFDTASRARTPRVLSQGTVEQLYLCMRLGLIDQLGEVGRGIPVMMDDVLVNFDPERAIGAAAAIADVATRRQVVLMTCHPSTAELFQRTASDATVLRLGC